MVNVQILVQLTRGYNREMTGSHSHSLAHVHLQNFFTDLCYYVALHSWVRNMHSLGVNGTARRWAMVGHLVDPDLLVLGGYLHVSYHCC